MKFRSTIIKIAAFCIACMCISILSPSPTLAHTLKTDNAISTVFHIDPADDPGINETSHIEFIEWSDAARDQTLDLTKCNCNVSITTSSSTLLNKSFSSIPYSVVKNDELSFPFVFPALDVYTITITGTPITPGAFQAFSLSNTIRVDRISGQKIPLWTQIINSDLLHWHHLSHVLIIAGGIIIGIILTMRSIREEKRQKEKQRAKNNL